MHHYPFHVGDYTLKTAHLPPMADLAYRRLLDLYYMQEGPIPNKPKWVANRIRLDSEEAIIGFVLREFFELRGSGNAAFWHNGRADQVIATYQKKVAVARGNGALHVAGTKTEPKSVANRTITRTRTSNHRNTPLPPEGAVAFAVFWEKYPRKVGRPKAEIAYAAALKRGATVEAILAGLHRHLPCEQWQDRTKVPHPTTWLNRDGWNDEVVSSPAAGGAATQWWDSKKGVLDKGIELRLPGPTDASDAAWFDFMAAVWLAAGDGPWLDEKSRAYPIYKRLRDGAPALSVVHPVKKAAHA